MSLGLCLLKAGFGTSNFQGSPCISRTSSESVLRNSVSGQLDMSVGPKDRSTVCKQTPKSLLTSLNVRHPQSKISLHVLRAQQGGHVQTRANMQPPTRYHFSMHFTVCKCLTRLKTTETLSTDSYRSPSAFGTRARVFRHACSILSRDFSPI